MNLTGNVVLWAAAGSTIGKFIGGFVGGLLANQIANKIFSGDRPHDSSTAFFIKRLLDIIRWLR